MDRATNTGEGNVPKVMKMCIEEVEKRGLDIDGLYPVSLSSRILGYILIVAGSNVVTNK